MISMVEFSKWTGITTFEILLHAIALFVSTLLLVLKVHSIVTISYWQIFYPLFFSSALNGYFLFIIFVRSVLEERQSKHAFLNNAFNFLRVAMLTLFEVLLCHKIGGDLEQAEVAVNSTYGLVFMPLWILMTSLGFQACRLL
uniref:Transmembrane protein 203 n=1 Tax=Acrobeloides nanus TaxID=290746 RepID=A0A914EGT3_9BILA